jgi:hypothetical protein
MPDIALLANERCKREILDNRDRCRLAAVQIIPSAAKFFGRPGGVIWYDWPPPFPPEAFSPWQTQRNPDPILLIGTMGCLSV